MAAVEVRVDIAADLRELLRAAALAIGRRLSDVDRVLSETSRDWLGQLGRLDPLELEAALISASQAELRAALVALGEVRRRPASLTPEGERLVRIWVADGEPLDRLLALCGAWEKVLFEHWVQAVEDAAATVPGPPMITRQAIGIFLEYLIALGTLLAGAHAARVADIRAGRPRTELRLVQDLLAGRASVPDGLPYDLSLTHVAFIAWGIRAKDVPAWLRAQLRRQMLSIPISETVVWGWIGCHGHHVDGTSLRRLERDLASLDSSLAFGDPGAGIEGFRRSHEQAHEARAVGAARARRLTVHGDVTLELLASQNVERARDFVLDELGPLAAAGPREPSLRRTLEVYLGSSLNATAAAAHLHVHDQTVTNRLRRIEDLIGRPIHTRRVELETALRLAYLVES